MLLRERGIVEQRTADFDERLHSFPHKSPAVSGRPSSQIEILNGLPCRTFHQIVDGADHHAASARRVRNHADVTEVGARDGMQVRRLRRPHTGG